MTLNELKNDVAMLGFESYIEDEACFTSSVNRALGLMYVDRPVSKTVRIPVSGPRVSMKKDFIEHRSGEEISFDVNGLSLSFVSSGEGECTIKNSQGGNVVFLTDKQQTVRQFIRSKSTVTFRGDYYFTVSNFAVFEDLASSKVTDIPMYTPRRDVSPSDYCKDFRAFAGLPTNRDGEPIEAALLRDGRISLPFEFTGDIYLTYYRTPAKITSGNVNVMIDVSEECASLLPLLTASFMWLDDDAAKAQYYMSLYRDSIANIKRFSTMNINTEYRVNGWA